MRGERPIRTNSASWIRTGLLAASLVLSASAVAAWGSEGHRVIADLALERLTPAARAKVRWLLSLAPGSGTPNCPVDSFADAATWLDCVRPVSNFIYPARNHYENVPYCEAPTKNYCLKGFCAVNAARQALDDLKNARKHDENREMGKLELVSLEELVHLVGDIHQPLHATDNGDRGGNEDAVTIAGRSTNLHRAWDDDLVVNAVGPDEGAAVALLRPSVAAYMSRSDDDMGAWLAESHRVGVTFVYRRMRNPPTCGMPAAPQALSRAYVDGSASIVRQQLAKAAARLARALNRAFQ